MGNRSCSWKKDYSDEVVGLPYTFEYNFDSYYWFKEGVKGPLFQYSHLEVTSVGTTTTSETYSINSNIEITSIGDESMQATIYVFPNPAVDYFTVKAAGMEQIELFNSLVQMVFYQNEVNANSYTVETDHFPPGVYMVQIKTQNGIASSKLQIQ